MERLSAVVEEFASRGRSSKAQAKRRASPKAIGQRDPSLRWPHLYDILRAKGYSKEKAARIANSRLRYRKKGRLQGLPYKQADNPGALKKVLAEQNRKKKSRTASALVAACYDKSCAPPPTGSGGSRSKSSSPTAPTGVSEKRVAKNLQETWWAGRVNPTLLTAGTLAADALRQATVSGDLNSFKEIHEACLAGNPLYSSNPAIGVVGEKTVREASIVTAQASQAALIEDGFPSRFKMAGPAKLEGAVIEVRDVGSNKNTATYEVNRSTVLSYNHALIPDVERRDVKLHVEAKDLVRINERPPQRSRVESTKEPETAVPELPPYERGWRDPEVKKKTIVAACYSRACAPPPTGSGGSSGSSLSQASLSKAAAGRSSHAKANTSVYPVDTFKTRRPSDSNPDAPGASDRSAVRGHRGMAGTDPERRIPKAGETVDIYRDLGRGREHKRGFPDGDAFSVRHASALPGEQTGLVVASTTGIILNSGRPSWAHSAKASAEVEGKRGVHGFIRGEVAEYRNPEALAKMVKDSPDWHKVTYYPGTQDFFDPATRRRFVGSDQVALVKGEFFAKNPKYVDTTAPVSPIEKKIQAAIEEAKRGALSASSLEFACYDKSCAPPPVGKGGSSKGGAGGHAIITSSEARGDSKPVSREEFQRLASIGQEKLDAMKRNSSPAAGLNDLENWKKLKEDTWNEVQTEWGGATIDSHTGKALPQGVNKYAMTVKDPGVNTLSIPIGSSQIAFRTAMEVAKQKFRPILEREGHHLGVFRDDDLGRIDFDPVIVVNNLSDVHTIGAATRAIGGAYNFADGNGYWPPHVKDS